MAKKYRVALAFTRTSVNEHFLAATFSGIHRFVLREPAWELILDPSGFPCIPLEQVPVLAPDGLLFDSRRPGDAELVRSWPFPAVDIGGLENPGLTPTVNTDELSLAFKAMTHFQQRGYTRVYFLGHQHNCLTRRRREALIQHRVGAGMELVAMNIESHQQTLDQIRQQLRDAMRQLTKPAGIFATHDALGRTICSALRSEKIDVPDEVAVLGEGNCAIHCMLSMPFLSSVSLRRSALGYAGAELLHRLFEGVAPPQALLHIEPSEIVPRESTDFFCGADKKMNAVIGYIRAHAADALYVEDLVKRFGISRRTLEHKMSDLVGHGPHAEIERQKLLLAKRMLLETSLPVSAIAEHLHFGAEARLYERFRAQFNETPGVFRKRVGYSCVHEQAVH